MKNLGNAKEMLQAGSYTCVLYREGVQYTSQARGVKPLVAWYEESLDLTGFSAADKVVGRATAFLYALLGVKAVYAGVISRPALAVLADHGIEAQYGKLVDNIINRAGDGICPFELAVLGISDQRDAYRAIRRAMEEMGITL